MSARFASHRIREIRSHGLPKLRCVYGNWEHHAALDAINAVLIRARLMATKRAPYEDLVAVLDIAEYLPTLFLRGDDQTDHFRHILEDIASKYPMFRPVLERVRQLLEMNLSDVSCRRLQGGPAR